MKRKKHIAHRFYDLYSGGAEVVVLNIIKALPKSWNHTLIFNNYWDTWVSKTLKEMKHVSLVQVKNNEEFIETINKRAPELILFHWYPPMKEGDLLIVENANYSPYLIVYSHWTQEIPPVRNAHKFVFVSNYCKEKYGTQIEDSRKITLYNPVADELLIEKAPAAKKREVFLLGRHSRPVHFKFPVNFFDIYEILDIPGLEIRVLGGDIFIPYEETIKKHKKKKYVFYPFNSMKTTEFLDSLDLFVYTVHKSSCDAFSLCIIEALARGIPVIVERKGGNVEQVIEGETGYLCDSREDFKRYIEELYRNPQKREEMGKNGLEWVKEHCSMKTFRKNIKKIIEKQ